MAAIIAKPGPSARPADSQIKEAVSRNLFALADDVSVRLDAVFVGPDGKPKGRAAIMNELRDSPAFSTSMHELNVRFLTLYYIRDKVSDPALWARAVEIEKRYEVLTAGHSTSKEEVQDAGAKALPSGFSDMGAATTTIQQTITQAMEDAGVPQTERSVMFNRLEADILLNVALAHQLPSEPAAPQAASKSEEPNPAAQLPAAKPEETGRTRMLEVPSGTELLDSLIAELEGEGAPDDLKSEGPVSPAAGGGTPPPSEAPAVPAMGADVPFVPSMAPPAAHIAESPAAQPPETSRPVTMPARMTASSSTKHTPRTPGTLQSSEPKAMEMPSGGTQQPQPTASAGVPMAQATQPHVEIPFYTFGDDPKAAPSNGARAKKPVHVFPSGLRVVEITEERAKRVINSLTAQRVGELLALQAQPVPDGFVVAVEELNHVVRAYAFPKDRLLELNIRPVALDHPTKKELPPLRPSASPRISPKRKLENDYVPVIRTILSIPRGTGLVQDGVNRMQKQLEDLEGLMNFFKKQREADRPDAGKDASTVKGIKFAFDGYRKAREGMYSSFATLMGRELWIFISEKNVPAADRHDQWDEDAAPTTLPEIASKMPGLLERAWKRVKEEDLGMMRIIRSVIDADPIVADVLKQEEEMIALVKACKGVCRSTMPASSGASELFVEIEREFVKSLTRPKAEVPALA